MPEKTLIANVRAADGNPGTLIVASPVVGRVDGVPSAGVYLNPFDAVLTVDILNERYTLRLPRDVQGRVTADLRSSGAHARGVQRTIDPPRPARARDRHGS